MKKLLSLFGIIWLIYLPVTSQEEKPRNWSLSGYVKNLQSVYSLQGLDQPLLDNLIHNRLNFRWYPHEHWTVRVEARNRLFYGDFVQLNLINGDQIEMGNNDRFDLSVLWIDKPSWVLNSTLDRAYVQYAKNSLEVRVGRQRINWGINTVWNPNDIFNAFSFTDFDYEERPGSDAILMRYYLGTASSIEIATNLGDTWDERTTAMLFKWNALQYDFQLLAGWASGDYVFGGGWAGNIKTAGFKGEWSVFTPDGAGGTETSFALSSGIDYVFGSGIFLGLGYLYNSNGTTTGTLATLFNFNLTAKNLYPFKHAIFLQTSYPLTSLINTGIAWIYSPVEAQTLFVNPTVTVSVAQNWDLDLIGQLSWNKDQGKFISPFSAGFLRIKFSF